MSYSGMSSNSRGSTDNAYGRGKAGRRYVGPQLVSLEFRLNVPEKRGKILLFRDPRPFRGLLVRCKTRGVLFHVCICARKFHRCPLFLCLFEGSKELGYYYSFVQVTYDWGLHALLERGAHSHFC
jgi:hypothetical protein